MREAEKGFNINNLQLAYRVIKRLSSAATLGLNTLLKVDAVIVVGHEG